MRWETPLAADAMPMFMRSPAKVPQNPLDLATMSRSTVNVSLEEA
jgi:hypothetical protein